MQKRKHGKVAKESFYAVCVVKPVQNVPLTNAQENADAYCTLYLSVSFVVVAFESSLGTLRTIEGLIKHRPELFVSMNIC